MNAKNSYLFLNSNASELTDDHNSMTTDVGNKVINNNSVPVRIEKLRTPTGGKKNTGKNDKKKNSYLFIFY